MAMTWLIDKSAYARLTTCRDAQKWADRIERGLVRISTVTRLEIGFSFQNVDAARRETVFPPLASMPLEYLTPAMERRGVEVQMALTARGQHRAASVPDLLIAATAELAKLTVLHVDKDFDLIAAVTGQKVETLDLR
jgi:predicted nucleic acid-binding protein